MSSLFRPNVAVIVTDGNGRVLVCERAEGGFATVQTVQGGIEPGEAAKEAAYREVTEELGIDRDQFEITAEMEKTYCYEWPEEYIKETNSVMRGQEQKFFLAVVPSDVQFRLDRHVQEFSRVWWGTPEELLSQSWEAKKPGLEAALRFFKLL